MANKKGAVPKLRAEPLFRRSPKTPRTPPKVNPVGSTQSTSNQSSVSTLGNTSVYLCQICGIADDVQKIHCDECTLWYHFACAHVSNEVMLQETWLCPPCKAKTLAIPASNVANIEGDKPTQQSIIQPPTVASGTYSTDVTDNSDKSGSATSSTSQITTLSINANAEPQSTPVQSVEHPLLVPATSTAFDLNTGKVPRKTNSVTSTMSRRAALALQRLEEERELRARRDSDLINESRRLQTERDDEYIKQKYVILEDDVMSNLSFDDEEIHSRKMESVHNWAESIPKIHFDSGKSHQHETDVNELLVEVSVPNQIANVITDDLKFDQGAIGGITVDNMAVGSGNVTSANTKSTSAKYQLNSLPDWLTNPKPKQDPASHPLSHPLQPAKASSANQGNYNFPSPPVPTPQQNIGFMPTLNQQGSGSGLQNVSGQSMVNTSTVISHAQTVFTPQASAQTSAPGQQQQQFLGVSQPQLLNLNQSQLLGTAQSNAVNAHQSPSVSQPVYVNQPNNMGQPFGQSWLNTSSVYQPPPTISNNNYPPISQPLNVNQNVSAVSGLNQSYAYGNMLPLQGAMTHTVMPIRLTAEQIASRHVVKDLPNFSGNPREWGLFISAYNTANETCGYSNSENLYRLQRSIKGDARRDVENLLLHKDSVPKIIDTLRLLYGLPEHVVETAIQDVEKLPPPKEDDLRSLIKFAMAIQNMSATIQHTGALEHLRNPHLLKSIIGKLPSQHQLNWAFYQASIVNANISHLGDWLYRIAEVASRVVRVTNNNKNSNSNKSNPFINSQVETEPVSKLAILDVTPPNEEQDVKVNQMESLNGGKNVVQRSLMSTLN